MSCVKKLTKAVFTFISPPFPLIAMRDCLPFPPAILSEPLLLVPFFFFTSLGKLRQAKSASPKFRWKFAVATAFSDCER